MKKVALLKKDLTYLFILLIKFDSCRYKLLLFIYVYFVISTFSIDKKKKYLILNNCGPLGIYNYCKILL